MAADPRRAGRRWALALALLATPATTATAHALSLGDRDDRGGLELAGNWSAGERAAIGAAWAQMPAEIRARAPRRVARDAVACDGESWPADDQDLSDAGGTVHLCAATPGAADGDSARRVALALLMGFDRAAGWSAEPAWRRLNRWHAALAGALAPRPDNQDPAGFAETRGRRSPAWDLATFLAALWLDPAGADGGIACRLMSQAAFARAHLRAPPAAARCAAFEDWADLDHLAEVEVVLAAPSTAMLGSLFGHLFLRLGYRDGAGDDDDNSEAAPELSRTIAFLADNDVPFTEDPGYALKGIFGRYAASLHERSFLDAYRDYVVVEGRDLRRWRLELDSGQRRALLERIWTVGHGSRYAYYFFRRNCATLMVDLVDDVRAPEASTAAPGLLAAPPATTLEPWAQATDAGGRPLLRFVPEPIWSFDHQARAAARHREALEPQLARALSAAQATAIAGALRATHGAEPGARAGGYHRLAALLTDTRAGSAEELRAWLRDSATIEMRLSIQANLEAEARADRRRRQQVDEAARQMLSALAGAAAALAADPDAGPAALGARLGAAVRQTAASDPAARLVGYRALLAITQDRVTSPALAGQVRLLALLQSERRYDVLRMKGVPNLRDQLLFVDPDQAIDRQPYLRQPYLAGREDLLRLPSETRISPPLRALQRTRQALFAARRLERGDDRQAGQPDGDRPDQPDQPDQPDGDRAPAVTLARREYEGSLPHSGIDRFSALVGQAFGAAPPRPGLILAGALYDEQLGDHHRFGFPSDTALVVARSALFLTAAGGKPSIEAYAARLFGYRSLRTPLPESGAGRWPLGWELWGDLEGDHARRLGTGATLGWGLLVPLADRDDLNDHLVAGLALATSAGFPAAEARARAGGAGTLQTLAVPLSLELRAGLGRAPRYRSDLGARLWVEPTALLAGTHPGIAAGGGARIEAHVALRPGPRPVGDGHDPALVVRAQVIRTPLTFAGPAAATVGLISAGVDLR